MKQNINEELKYMKYLFGYKKGVVISEQETAPVATTQQTTTQQTTTQQTTTPETQGGDGCQQIEIKSPSFSNSQADHTKFVEPITTKLNELISQNPAFKGGTITKMEIIGGASNVDGGKVTSFSLTNDYTPVEPKNTSGTGYQNNMEYARKRGELAKTTLLPILTGTDYGLKIGFDPIVTPAVIDTGGVQDSNTKRKPNPGQIVIIRMTVCPIKQESSREGGGDGQTTTTETQITQIIPEIVECFTGVVVKVNFDENATDQGHNCQKAVWDITANDIPIFRINKNGRKVSYASLNNIFDAYDDAEVRAPKNGKEKGGYRYNTFTIDEITAQQFANLGSVQKYQGDLQIQMKCQIGSAGTLNIDGHKTSGGGCHKGTVFVEVLSKEVKEATLVKNAPVKSGQKADVYKVPACKGVYQKIAPELQKFQIPRENPDVRDPKVVDYMRQSLSVGGNK